MTTPFACLFIACLLPYVWSFASVLARRQQFERIDNQHPRAQQAQLTGWGARAIAAHKNAFEAIAVFAPAVLVAHAKGASPDMAALLSMVFVLARIAHGVCYVANQNLLRSLSFVVATACSIGLFWIS